MRIGRWFTLLWLLPLWGGVALYGSDLTGSDPAKGPPSAQATPAKPAEKPKDGCGRFGTQVDFVGTPSEAARKARAEEKLVFVLHISGHFEDPRFT
jgi:hypothetical protein